MIPAISLDSKFNTLPNGEPIKCPAIQIRRVWEIWERLQYKHPYDIAVQSDGEYIAVRDRSYDEGLIYKVLPNAEVLTPNGGAENAFPWPPPLLPEETVAYSAEQCEKLIEDISKEWRNRFRYIWRKPWLDHGRI
jgi:hypothetical protein